MMSHTNSLFSRQPQPTTIVWYNKRKETNQNQMRATNVPEPHFKNASIVTWLLINTVYVFDAFPARRIDATTSPKQQNAVYLYHSKHFRCAPKWFVILTLTDTDSVLHKCWLLNCGSTGWVLVFVVGCSIKSSSYGSILLHRSLLLRWSWCSLR